MVANFAENRAPGGVAVATGVSRQPRRGRLSARAIMANEATQRDRVRPGRPSRGWYVPPRMRPPSPEADLLDLPPLDGTDDEKDGIIDPDEEFDADTAKDLGDALDDATGEGDSMDELVVEGAEGGWLLDSEDSRGLDVGVFDISLGTEMKLLEDDEPDLRAPVDEELGGDEASAHGDGGEEGPLAEDEELREEDLPALDADADADEDGDVDDASLFEGASIGLGLDDELRWDDRAWARVGQTRLPGVDAMHVDDADDSGLLAVPGDDPKLAARDATWRRLEETGRVTAAALVPGDTVIVALDGPERPMLVRILTDGAARIIAEIEAATDDEQTVSSITGLRWDASRGSLVVTGTFGAQAFRPA